MREIRPSGSEGGGAEANRLSLPLFGVTLIPPLQGGQNYRRLPFPRVRSATLGFEIQPLRG